MKAIYLHKYGTPDDLELIEVDKPTPKEGEVLVRIKAAAVNDYDWSMVSGRPYAYRIFFGIFKPKRPIPGMELSGVIEGLGSNTNKFQIGDPVYGDTSDHGFGSFAEYICINEKALTLKPQSMSFEQATAIPHASLLAYQGLVVKGNIQSEQKILVNGAGGGVGTFALQIAKDYNCHVTGVDTGDKLNMMKSLGFDEIIDYKLDDFANQGIEYDLILDARTTRSPFDCVKALREGGNYVTVGGEVKRMLQILLFASWIKRFSKKKIFILGLKANEGLEKISELFEAGKLKCIIDGPYKLSEVPIAIARFGASTHEGKIVISMNEELMN